MLFSEESAAAAGGASESAASDKSGDREAGDDQAALKRMGEQRDAARSAQRESEKALKAVQDRLTELEGKDKTDVERLTAERDRFKADLEARETRLREMAIRNALTGAASKGGARYPELIVDRLRTQADLDDDLNVTNADALVTAAKREYPDLFRIVDGTADGGKGNGTTDTSHLRGQSRLSYAHGQRSRSG